MPAAVSTLTLRGTHRVSETLTCIPCYLIYTHILEYTRVKPWNLQLRHIGCCRILCKNHTSPGVMSCIQLMIQCCVPVLPMEENSYKATKYTLYIHNTTWNLFFFHYFLGCVSNIAMQLYMNHDNSAVCLLQLILCFVHRFYFFIFFYVFDILISQLLSCKSIFPKGKYFFASRGEATIGQFIFGNKMDPENKLLENDEQEEIIFYFDSFWWINSTLKQSYEMAANIFSLWV